MRDPLNIASRISLSIWLFPVLVAAPVLAAEPTSGFRVEPAQIELRGELARQQLLATVATADQRMDVTRLAAYRSDAPEIAAVDAAGVVRPVGDGTARILVSHDGDEISISVRVSQMAVPAAIDFERDLVPIFDRAGCNAGACHGKARGQNGFAMSLLGFDPQFDHEAILKEGRGRRVFPPAPERSLMVEKPTGRVPHGGGKRLDANSAEIRILEQWIRTGTPRRQPDVPPLQRITVSPTDRQLKAGEQQQLLVTAHYEDGSTRDVTHLSAYLSNESAIAAVNEHGLVTAGMVVGESAVMARFRGEIAVCQVALPLPGTVSPEAYAALPRQNFIDELVWAKLARLGLLPSERCSDEKFLRRAFIDIVGRVPRPDDVRAFAADESPEKRARLIDSLLQDPGYADHWTNKWADLLRPNAYHVGIKTVLNYDDWIRDSFRKNKPYDQFVRELVTARGSTFRDGHVTLFRDRRTPDDITTIISQLFLGIRLECAKCHHHPFEVWGQDDFYSFAAYFAKIGRKGRGISAPISGSEEFIFAGTRGEVKHPLTGEVLEPRPLFGAAPEIAEGDDPRDSLAAWMTSSENPYLAQTMANRVWADLMGRGIVEPVDDLRATNPPSNGPLLERLADDFRENKYDIKHLIRRIANSHVYQLDSLPNERNAVDTRNYSRHYRDRLRAEVLVDGICEITGVPESFAAMPPGSTAKQIFTHRVGSLFLDAFGRPDPNQDPPCERTTDTTIVQALHLMNSENVFRKVTSDQGTAAKLAASEKTAQEIVEELYLLAYSRFPTGEEVQTVLPLFGNDAESRRRATEDILWAMLNTPEFVFKD